MITTEDTIALPLYCPACRATFTESWRWRGVELAYKIAGLGEVWLTRAYLCRDGEACRRCPWCGRDLVHHDPETVRGWAFWQWTMTPFP